MSTLLRQLEEQFGLTLVEEGKIVTNSVKVANVYGKDHADVLKKIRKFIELIPELGLGNFPYPHTSMNRIKINPCS